MGIGKKLLDYTYLFSWNDWKRMTKQQIIVLKINMVEEASPEFRLKEKLIKQEIIFLENWRV